MKGLEPTHLSALDPKSSVSTNFTTSAKPIYCPVGQIGAQRYKRIEKEQIQHPLSLNLKQTGLKEK